MADKPHRHAPKGPLKTPRQPTLPAAACPQKSAGDRSKGHGAKHAGVRERAILALLSESSIIAAAQQAGIDERTLRRWLQEPAFRSQFDVARQQIVQEAHVRLDAYLGKAVDRLFQLIEQTDFPSTALSAVRDVLDRTTGKPAERVTANVDGEVVIRWDDGRARNES